MRRRTHRRSFRSHSRRTNPRRRRRSFRANAFVPLPNPRRRRSVVVRRANPKRRSFRRNPFSLSGGTILGFPIKQVAIAGGAVIVAPYLQAQLMRLLPTSIASTTSGRWAVKIGTAAATGYLAKLAMGQEASRLAYITLGANLVADAVSEFMAPAAGTGYFQGLGAFPAAGGGFGAAGFPRGYVQGGMSANGPYTGVFPGMAAPMSLSMDPYRPSM